MRELSRRVAEAVGWTDIATRPTKIGFYDTESLTGIPPINHLEEWKRQQIESGLTIYWEVPDYEHDVAACIAALDATGVQWVLRNHDDVTFMKVNQCEINAVMGEGATPAEAMCNALLAYYEQDEQR